MSETPQNDTGDNSKNGIQTVLIVVALLPLLYFLSIGPAAWAFDNGYIQYDGFVEAFYWPLEWLYENTFLEKPIDGYVELFVG